MKLILLLFIFERAIASVTPQAASSIRGLGDGSATVNLGYAVYRGTRLSAGVDQYLGMRYAAPPLADRRFRAPVDPVHEEGIQDASTLGPLCIGVGQKISAELNEDCLFVNIFTPSKVTLNSNLPVWVYIQGGGYAQNANGNYNGTEVVQKSGYSLILVNFNYRVGALGFLAANEVQRDGDLNVGLLDQRKLLRWVQRYIRKFGGDPNQVVIHGA
ncbi:Carboxylesterase, partial [Bisporella sp. PMI_857]